MHFVEGSFYHLYNRGNNKQPIFFQNRNYELFFQKLKRYLAGHNNILAWCFMPNHFHVLIYANEPSTKVIKQDPIPVNATSEGIRLLLSSYTKALQKQESFTGNLFQQKTKAKCVDDCPETVLHYIHQNPMKAKLTERMENWNWSSMREYTGAVGEKICNLDLAYSLLNINKESFLKDSYQVIPEMDLKKIF
jgi:putative transposase